MTTSRFAWSAVLTTVLLGGSALAQPAPPFQAPAARVARAVAGQPLARGAAADPVGLVREYLRASGHAGPVVDGVVLVSRSVTQRTGVTHLRFVQRIGELDVYGVYVKAAVDPQGQLTSVIENLVPVRGPLAATLQGGPGRALAIGLQHLHGGAPVPPGLLRQQGNVSVFARTPFFHREPTVTRVAVPVGGTLRVGYLVETWTQQSNQLHHTIVGGDGAVLGVEPRTASDTYRVFVKNPEVSMQTDEPGPGTTTASPVGWLSPATTQRATSISGNNVHAYLDVDADNQDDGGGTVVTSGQFLSVWEGDAQPATTANREVATQNLFYLNNVTHDRLYGYGFVESTGNFQENNFDRGGADGDGVLAEVQDGSGTDNANFATPPDGSNPRMQMYVWSGAGPDAQVVVGSEPYGAKRAAFGPAPTDAGLTAPMIDGGDGCTRPARNAFLGAIALIDRGTCDFTVKATNAQRGGAVALVVINNTAGLPIVMGGTGSIRIPSVMVSQADGAALRAVTAGTPATVRSLAGGAINRDSSLDSDVVYHEYGHGLTWRMIGSMSGVMSGAIGEGMSDVLALLLNDDNDVIGEYAASDPIGIRSAPYTNYARKYSAFSGSGVHFDGEIYGAIGWRLRENFRNAGKTTDELLGYLVEGMNFTPAGPAFEDMRDGILQAIDAGDTFTQCLVWDAFADYEVGVGASAATRGKRVIVSPSTALPAGCAPVP